MEGWQRDWALFVAPTGETGRRGDGEGRQRDWALFVAPTGEASYTGQRRGAKLKLQFSVAVDRSFFNFDIVFGPSRVRNLIILLIFKPHQR